MSERGLVVESRGVGLPHLREGQVMGEGETKCGSLGQQVANSLGMSKNLGLVPKWIRSH